MKKIFLFLLLPLALSAQSFSPSGNHYLGSSTPLTGGPVYFYLVGSCSGTTCTGSVALCMSSNASSCNGTQVANTSIFYTLDGSPANEASEYYTPGNSITLPSPSSTQQIIVNAVLVQTTNTGSIIQTGATTPGCSSASPCHAEIYQDGMNNKSWLKMNVACAASGASPSTHNCPATVFAQTSTPISGGTESGSATTPTVQHGGTSNASTCTPNLGVRGVPTGVWYYTSQSQPTVDLYIPNTDSTIEMDLGTTSAVDCLGGSSGTGEGDTEDLVPVQVSTNISPGSTGRGCNTCTVQAASYYISHVYAGKPASGSTLNPANLSEEEQDKNWQNGTFNTATGNGYGTSNYRCSMYNAPSITCATGKCGQWQFSSQNGTPNLWATFPTYFPSIAAITHDCTFPFGTLAALGTTGCPTATNFTPGVTNSLYNGGENSPGLEPGFLVIDALTSNSETMLLQGSPGGPITGCLRPNPKTHAAGAFTTLFVKVMTHATSDIATGSSGCIGLQGSGNTNIVYADYFMANGNYHGIPAYKTLLGTSNINVLATWGTQNIGGNARSLVCSYYGSGTSATNGFNQFQPYMKAGTGNPSLVGQFIQHENFTLSWGIVGSGPAQLQLTQNP